jgi:hypothetical protein
MLDNVLFGHSCGEDLGAACLFFGISITKFQIISMVYSFVLQDSEKVRCLNFL